MCGIWAKIGLFHPKLMGKWAKTGFKWDKLKLVEKMKKPVAIGFQQAEML